MKEVLLNSLCGALLFLAIASAYYSAKVYGMANKILFSIAIISFILFGIVSCYL